MRSDYPDLSEYILSILSENAVNDGTFSVVDRQQLDAIRAELDFQISGEVSDESAQGIGRLLGAEGIVSGTINKIGPLYRVQVKAIEVETAGVQGQWSKNLSADGTLVSALTERFVAAPVANSASNRIDQVQTPAVQAPASSTTTTAVVAESPKVEEVISYKIGDTGPAGGIVFYDKGNNQGGWRYLEAAPADIGNAVYCTEELKINEMEAFNDDEGRGIGKGKSNTAYIMELAGKKGGGFGWAAQLCEAYEHNGYDDWFLPSRDELNYMYGNLYMRGMGELRQENYWSSTGHWNTYQAWHQNFSNGEQATDYIMSGNYRVRAVRQF
jgi:hypothetical protein